MVSHDVEIVRLIPPGKNNYHYIAVCSCGRWRSSPYRDYADADRKGLAHHHLGDLQNTAAAGLEHNGGSLRGELSWYRSQAQDPLNDEKDREVWLRLAESLERRLGLAPPVDEDAPLW